MTTIHQFTETTREYPGYVSINDDAGNITISVRNRGGMAPAVITMSLAQLRDLHAEVGAYLASLVTPLFEAEAPPPDTITNKPAKASK